MTTSTKYNMANKAHGTKPEPQDSHWPWWNYCVSIQFVFLHAQSFTLLLHLRKQFCPLWYHNWKDKISVINTWTAIGHDFRQSLQKCCQTWVIYVSEHLITLTETAPYLRIIFILTYPLIMIGFWFCPPRKSDCRSWILPVNPHRGTSSKTLKWQAPFWRQLSASPAQSGRPWPESWT